MNKYGYPTEWIKRARQLNRFGYGAKSIVKHMKDEGKDVKVATVENWISYQTRAKI